MLRSCWGEPKFNEMPRAAWAGERHQRRPVRRAQGAGGGGRRGPLHLFRGVRGEGRSAPVLPRSARISEGKGGDALCCVLRPLLAPPTAWRSAPRTRGPPPLRCRHAASMPLPGHERGARPAGPSAHARRDVSARVSALRSPRVGKSLCGRCAPRDVPVAAEATCVCARRQSRSRISFLLPRLTSAPRLPGDDVDSGTKWKALCLFARR